MQYQALDLRHSSPHRDLLHMGRYHLPSQTLTRVNGSASTTRCGAHGVFIA